MVGRVEHYNADLSCLQSTEGKFWEADGTERTLRTLPGSSFTVPLSINKHGQVAGYVQGAATGCNDFPPLTFRGVLWQTRRTAWPSKGSTGKRVEVRLFYCAALASFHETMGGIPSPRLLRAAQNE